MRLCHRCGKEWGSDKREPGVKETCPGCNAYLHCCLNCRFYDKSKPNQCQVPNTEAVSDRAGCNFCDEFEFVLGKTAGAEEARARAAHDALRDLLGEDDGEGITDKGRDAFNKLFDD